MDPRASEHMLFGIAPSKQSKVLLSPFGNGMFHKAVSSQSLTTPQHADGVLESYSEFDDLRNNLVRAFPQLGASIPELPRKSVVSRFRTKFLDSRRAGLSHFLKYDSQTCPPVLD